MPALVINNIHAMWKRRVAVIKIIYHSPETNFVCGFNRLNFSKTFIKPNNVDNFLE